MGLLTNFSRFVHHIDWILHNLIVFSLPFDHGITHLKHGWLCIISRINAKISIFSHFLEIAAYVWPWRSYKMSSIKHFFHSIKGLLGHKNNWSKCRNLVKNITPLVFYSNNWGPFLRKHIQLDLHFETIIMLVFNIWIN